MNARNRMLKFLLVYAACGAWSLVATANNYDDNPDSLPDMDAYHAYLTQKSNDCKQQGQNYQFTTSYSSIQIGPASANVSKPGVACNYVNNNNNSYGNNNYNGNGNGNYGNGNNYNNSNYDPNSNCNNAQNFDTVNGTKCVTAENVIENVKGRNDMMNQMDTTAAGAIQVANAVQIPQTQQQALSQQELNLKATIATTVLESGMHAYNATALNGASDDANSAARGIKNAQQAYDDASNAGANAAAQSGMKFKAEFQDRLGSANTESQITAGTSSPSRASLRAGQDSTLSGLVTNPQASEQQAMQNGANAFRASLNSNGADLDSTAQNYNSYQQMRGATGRGITESKDVASQADAGSSESTMLAMGSALQAAEAIAQLRQLEQTQNTLPTLPGQAPIALETPGVASSTPPPSNLPSAYAPSPALDLGNPPLAAQARQPMQGTIQAGQSFTSSQYKPRMAQTTSGASGKGIGGGGGAGGNKAPPGRPGVGPSSTDYGGGGGHLNNMAAGGAAGGPNSDLQDAIKSILGMGDKKDANAQLEQYRELASVGDKSGEDSGDDSRTLFERVNAKYGDLQNNGVI